MASRSILFTCFHRYHVGQYIHVHSFHIDIHTYESIYVFISHDTIKWLVPGKNRWKRYVNNYHQIHSVYIFHFNSIIAQIVGLKYQKKQIVCIRLQIERYITYVLYECFSNIQSYILRSFHNEIRRIRGFPTSVHFCAKFKSIDNREPIDTDY